MGSCKPHLPSARPAGPVSCWHPLCVQQNSFHHWFRLWPFSSWTFVIYSLIIFSVMFKSCWTWFHQVQSLILSQTVFYRPCHCPSVSYTLIISSIFRTALAKGLKKASSLCSTLHHGDQLLKLYLYSLLQTW